MSWWSVALGKAFRADYWSHLFRGRNTQVALDLARGLSSDGGHVTALKIMKPDSKLAEIEAGARRLREDLEMLGAAGLGQLVVRAESRSKGILEAIDRGYDGLVMAAPQEPLLERLCLEERNSKLRQRVRYL